MYMRTEALVLTIGRGLTEALVSSAVQLLTRIALRKSADETDKKWLTKPNVHIGRGGGRGDSSNISLEKFLGRV